MAGPGNLLRSGIWRNLARNIKVIPETLKFSNYRGSPKQPEMPITKA